MNYPYEKDIEKLAQEHFGLCWSFEACRQLPHDILSGRMRAIRALVYKAMQDSYTRGRQDERAGVQQFTNSSEELNR